MSLSAATTESGVGPLTNVVLIVPTCNEEAAIGAALAPVPRAWVNRIIVADGDSTDATVARARAAGAEVLDAGYGYGRACLLGARAADEDSVLVFMDGDGADRADRIPELLAPIIAGSHDFVIASRTRGSRAPGSMAWHQLAAGWIIGGVLGLLYGVRYTDMCAFRAIRRRHLLTLGMREMTYGWNLEMQMRVARAGLRVLEIPVPYGLRRGGESKVAGNLRGSLRAGARILATLVRVALQGRNNPGIA